MEVPLDIASQRAERVDLTLDLLSVDTSTPPGTTREIVELIEAWVDPLDVDTERFGRVLDSL